MRNRRRTVLIADSQRATAQGLRIGLERAGFTVFTASDLEQASILAARQRFEMIIANLNLPQDGGTKFCSHVRDDLGLTEVPIVVYTDRSTESELQGLVYQYGVTKIFNAPIDPVDVVEFANEAIGYAVTAR